VLLLGGLITMWPGGGPVTSGQRRAPAEGYKVAVVGAGEQ
jgi:hypothetical protein